MNILHFLGFHKWIYYNVQHPGAYYWERKCEICLRHEITIRSGNTLRYNREDAEMLPYREVNKLKKEQKHDNEMRLKLFR